MSSTWEFIKRHKGKIIAGGVLISGAAVYALQTKQSHQSTPLNSSRQKNLRVQARRHYVFDTNHRACDQSIVDIVPNLRALIQRRFDIESLIHKLKEGNNLSIEEKIQIWEKVKIFSVARIAGIAYSYSLLTLALKAQISILAADICLQFEKPSSSWFDSFKSQVEYYLGFDAAPSSELSADERNFAASRKVFIQCIQYLTNTGVSKLLNVIEEACKDACSAISLRDRVNQDNLREVLESIDDRMLKLDPSFYSKLVAPLSEEERSSKDGVMQLLTRLVKSLESSKGRETMLSLVDFYLSAAVHKMPKEPAVLAKLLPSMPDVFHFISTDGYDSPLRNSLCSSDVHKFAKFVFKTL